MKHVRIDKDIRISDALTFLAGDRQHLEEAWPGDIIGLHNHGTIQIGDTFTSGENCNLPVFRTLHRKCSAVSV